MLRRGTDLIFIRDVDVVEPQPKVLAGVRRSKVGKCEVRIEQADHAAGLMPLDHLEDLGQGTNQDGHASPLIIVVCR